VDGAVFASAVFVAEDVAMTAAPPQVCGTIIMWR
jgi:hypothetical protein